MPEPGGGRGRDERVWVVDDPPNERFPIWTRGNVGEVFPAVVSPLTWSLYGPDVERGWRDAFERVRCPPARRLRRHLPRQRRLLRRLLLPQRVHPPGLRRAHARAHPRADGPGDLRRVRGPALPGGARRQGPHGHPARRPHGGPHPLRQVAAPQLDADKRDGRDVARRPARSGCRPPTTSSGPPSSEFRAMFRQLFARHIVTTFRATIPTGVLTDLCTDKLGDPGLVVQLLGGIGEVESAEPPCHLWRLSRLVADDATLTAAFDAGLDGLARPADRRARGRRPSSTGSPRFQAALRRPGPERVGGLVADVGHRAHPRPRRRRRHAQGRPRPRPRPALRAPRRRAGRRDGGGAGPPPPPRPPAVRPRPAFGRGVLAGPGAVEDHHRHRPARLPPRRPRAGPPGHRPGRAGGPHDAVARHRRRARRLPRRSAGVRRRAGRSGPPAATSWPAWCRRSCSSAPNRRRRRGRRGPGPGPPAPPPATCCAASPGAPASPAAGPASCSTPATPATSAPATSSSRRSPTRRGRRCSCRPRRSSSTSAPR